MQALSANDTAGHYAVTASCIYGIVSFTLTNSAAGIPVKIPAIGPTTATATVAKRYSRRLRVKVGTAANKPVAGVSVTFTLAAAPTTADSGSGGAGAAFTGGSTRATVLTDAHGIATSPRITANDRVGGFTATATSNAASHERVFHLHNRVGPPATVTVGVGAAQSTAARTRFAIALAVTVTDTYGNKVPRAHVTFTSPRAGPSGSFPGRKITVTVKTNPSGIAVAPRFTANRQAGGYIVTAVVRHVRPVAFALVNTER